MKDSYSFDMDRAGLDRSFELHDAVYRRIFTRCGLKFVAVEADSGSMGGSQSQEFMVYTDAGEDLIASCPVCGYAANLEKATSRLEPVKELEPTANKPEEIHTPGMGAIADVAAFLKMSPANDIKCVAYMALHRGDKDCASFWLPVVAFLRGDHQVNETKLLGAVEGAELRPMTAEEIEAVFHAPAGFLGPIGIAPFLGFPGYESLLELRVKIPEVSLDYLRDKARFDKPLVVLDQSLKGRKNMVCGANKLDYHLRNVMPGRDFTWTLSADIRSVNEGEACPKDGCAGRLVVGKAVEIGHIFKLGYKYSESMGARVLDVNGKEVTPIMGSYGIGIERILTASVEQANDKNGFWLPAAIAPFTVVVTVTNSSDASLAEAGEKLAAELEAAGLDVLLDDRDERAGVKFKDADLVGVPYRINVGKKAAGGFVELQTRSTATSVDVALADVVALVKARVEEDALLTEVEG
jgi:prolyl-tRNA synthetase